MQQQPKASIYIDFMFVFVWEFYVPMFMSWCPGHTVTCAVTNSPQRKANCVQKWPSLRINHYEKQQHSTKWKKQRTLEHWNHIQSYFVRKKNVANEMLLAASFVFLF